MAIDKETLNDVLQGTSQNKSITELVDRLLRATSKGKNKAAQPKSVTEMFGQKSNDLSDWTIDEKTGQLSLGPARERIYAKQDSMARVADSLKLIDQERWLLQRVMEEEKRNMVTRQDEESRLENVEREVTGFPGWGTSMFKDIGKYWPDEPDTLKLKHQEEEETLNQIIERFGGKDFLRGGMYGPSQQDYRDHRGQMDEETLRQLLQVLQIHPKMKELLGKQDKLGINLPYGD
jgi:hypothetical protein